MPDPHNRIFLDRPRGRLALNPDHAGELMAYLTVHLTRCQTAIARIRRTQTVFEDGTETTNANYYIHAAGYLTKMLKDLMHTMPVSDMVSATLLLVEAMAPPAAPPANPTPEPAGEGQSEPPKPNRRTRR